MGIYRKAFDYNSDYSTERSNKVGKLSFTFPILKFKDDLVKKLNIAFGNIDTLFLNMTDGEAYLNYNSLEEYVISRYMKNNKNVPNIFRFTDDSIYYDKFVDKFFNILDIPQSSYVKHSILGDERVIEMSSIVLALTEDCYIIFFDSEISIIYNKKYENEEPENNPLKVFCGLAMSFKTPIHEKNKIFVVYRDRNGNFAKEGFNIKKIKISLEDNYNDGFVNIFNNTVKYLNDKKINGLVVWEGLPGSGKTYAIRYLASKLKKNVIFIPPDMVEYITDPSFIPFLIQNDNSILLIEDAEPALEKRGNSGRSGSVSNILNLADGLLSDCVNISILCTFNTNKKDLDEALFRKGRLLLSYKFDKLDINKSEILLKKLGHKVDNVEEAMSLADIYNYDVDNNSEVISKERKEISLKR